MSQKSIFAILLLCIILQFSPYVLAADKTVVARVAEVPVTEYEVQRKLDKVMPFRVSFHGKVAQNKLDTIRAEVVDELIVRAYKVKYAAENKIIVPAVQLDDALAKVKAHYKTDKEFDQALSGETIAGLRASIYRDLVARKAEAEVVDTKISISDEDVEKQYNDHKQMYFLPMQFQASHILVKVDPAANENERADLLAKAVTLRDQAKAGEDFYNLAYYNSDDRTRFVGGDLGMFHEGQTAKPFEDALKELEIGEVSDLVKTRWGYHIIKLTQKNPPRQIPFPEIKAKIKAQLVEKQREKIYQQWVSDLKNKYSVEFLRE